MITLFSLKLTTVSESIHQKNRKEKEKENRCVVVERKSQTYYIRL